MSLSHVVHTFMWVPKSAIYHTANLSWGFTDAHNVYKNHDHVTLLVKKLYAEVIEDILSFHLTFKF